MNILIFKTRRGGNYWEKNSDADYKIEFVRNPEKYNKRQVIPAIGCYEKDQAENCFVYLKMMGVEINNIEVKFKTEYINKSKTKSSLLSELINTNIISSGNYFLEIEFEKFEKILNNLDEDLPQSWLDLAKLEIEKKNGIVITDNLTDRHIEWKDYVGKYFLEILTSDLNFEIFEDIVAKILIALGFKVEQYGHKSRGEYCDGIAAFDNYIIVYDCKNSKDYFPTATNKRALSYYIETERKRRGDSKFIGAFIPKSIRQDNADFMHKIIPVEELLYMLYKKISLGNSFKLNPISLFFENDKKVLTKDFINKEWKEKNQE